jgi:precorrin-6B methylase 2
MAGASITDGKSAPHVVLSWGNHPGYIPPPLFSPNQTTLCTGEPGKGPRFDTERFAVHGWTGGPRADLGEALRAAGRTAKPDLIVVATDVYKKNRMSGLDAFDCPKLLLVGDTHHGPRPLETILTYAKTEGFDAIAIQFTLHHAHWFRAAGFERIAWVPGLTAHLCTAAAPSPRPAIISFAGQLGPVFPRRTRLFKALCEAGLPAFHFEVPRPDLEHVLRASPLTFNCSVNGDLNLRLFEAASAGSLLLTDRLSDSSGLDRLFEPGVECAIYDTSAELLDLCRYYLRRPDEAATIAERARQRIVTMFGDDRLATRLARWALGDGPAPFEVGDDPRCRIPSAGAPSLDVRLAIYQIAQLIHVERESPRAFIGPGCPATSALDMSDLPRLRLTVAKDRADVRALLDKAGFANRYTIAEPPDAATDWDLWLAGGPVDAPPPALMRGTVAPLTDLNDVARTLNAEALQRYKTPARMSPGSSARYAITQLSGPQGPLNLVMRSARETSDMLKRIFGDRAYAPYPSVRPIRFIVHIGADAAPAAAFFRPSFPDATIVCLDDNTERLRLLSANAASLGDCRIVDIPLEIDGDANPALAAAIRAVQEETGLTEIDIVTVDAAGRSSPVIESLGPILPTIRSLFVNLGSIEERSDVAKRLEPSHAPWRPQLEDKTPLFRRYIRRDLSNTPNSAAPATA